jgi:hypothetical protein
VRRSHAPGSFDLLIGFNRPVASVGAYAAGPTAEYPPSGSTSSAATSRADGGAGSRQGAERREGRGTLGA